MKIVKIYSGDPAKFHNIEFNEGFNVIIGKISDKSKTDKDCHNLGKTLLISLIDFLLLKKINDKNKFFLTRDGFENEEFFIELKLNDGRYLIIKRSIKTPTKISFKINKQKTVRFITDFEWTHKDMAIDNAQNWLNDQLAFDVLTKWSFRKSVSYSLRSQNDFRDVFQLYKFKGSHSDWKPMMFELLGFDSEGITLKYGIEEENKELNTKIDILKKEAQIDTDERDKIQGLVEIKTDERDKIEQNIEKFNFLKTDKEFNQKLVDDIDYRIQVLNSERYNLSSEIRKIQKSLEKESVNLNVDKLFKLFEEIKFYFPDELKHDYQHLIEFNRLTLDERNKMLAENLKEASEKLSNIEKQIADSEQQKEDILSFLITKDSYDKFKTIQRDLSQLEAEIITLKEKLKLIDQTSLLHEKIEKNNSELANITKEIKKEIFTLKHTSIRMLFNDIIKMVLSTNALLSIKQNKQGNIEFEANIQNPQDLTITNEDSGNSYRKLLCMAFDISVMINYSSSSFYKFIYHDGALEALDDRKKILFLKYVSEMCKKYDLQYIITLIDSDLPSDINGKTIEFPDSEIVLELHDKDDTGKLFKRSF